MSHFNVESANFNEDDIDPSYLPLFDELIEDAIWDVCFEVHRAARHRILLVKEPSEDNENKNLKVSQENCSEQTLRKKKKKPTNSYQVKCDKCSSTFCATKAAKHLQTCFLKLGRPCAMTANTKLAEKSDDDDDDFHRDSEKKVKRGRKPKAQGKSKERKGQGNPSLKLTCENFENMPFEKRIALFSKICGAKSKCGKNMCQNMLNCPVHSEDQRLEIRRRFLGNQTTDDEHMDIDTVDKGVSINGSSASFTNFF